MKFVKSLIGLIPCQVNQGVKISVKREQYGCKPSKNIVMTMGKIIIPHAWTSKGENIVMYKGKTLNIKHRLNGYFEHYGQNKYISCN